MFSSGYFQTQVDKELANKSSVSVVYLIDLIIKEAHKLRSSDVHFDPTEEDVRVRIRVDGNLQDFCFLPKNLHPALISRLKVLSGLRTDDHQTAQDGRFSISTNTSSKENFDIRISIVPTYYGQNAVLRILAPDEGNLFLSDLGFSSLAYKKIKKSVSKPHGMILATGPTGSGKTTTLYSLLRELNKSDRSIITIEDPIEYAMLGLRQIPVNSQSGLSFSNGLRSVLRQDPDIIMVGEIRDFETARLAVNTALTGHLLLSTLHTNDASSAIPRLFDMKVEPFLVASTVNLIIAQRLLRRLCPNCKQVKKLSNKERSALLSFGFSTEDIDGLDEVWSASACDKCFRVGYVGRIVLAETLLVDDDIRECILAKKSSSEIKNMAISKGMTPILKDGLDKVRSGLTSLEELLKIAHE